MQKVLQKSIHFKNLNSFIKFNSCYRLYSIAESIILSSENGNFENKKKRKTAILMGYTGTGFSGLQYNPKQPYDTSIF